jgi:hypothetical protein
MGYIGLRESEVPFGTSWQAHPLVKGCDRFIVTSVELEYGVQICASKHVGDMPVGRDQLEIAAAIPCRDKKSNQNADSATVDMIHFAQVHNNVRRTREHAIHSFAQNCAFVTKNEATVAMEDEHIPT